MAGNILGFVVPFLIIVGIAAVIGGIVYFVMRLRAGESVTVSLGFLLTAYLYLATIVAILVAVNGVSLLVNAGLSGPFGKELSYQAQPIYPSGPVIGPDGNPVKPGTPTSPTLAEQQAQRAKALDQAYKEGVIYGIISLVFGVLVAVVHVVVRRFLQRGTDYKDTIMHKAYLIILLVIFGIGSIITLPQAASEAVHYYVVGPPDLNTYANPPGPALATAIVFTPIWIYYLFVTLRAVRKPTA